MGSQRKNILDILRMVALVMFVGIALSGCKGIENELITDKNKHEDVSNVKSDTDITNEKNVLNDGVENVQSEGGIVEIIWAFPTFSFDRNKIPIEDRINKKLAEDGYNFRIKCIYLDAENYPSLVGDCKADIVYTGIKTDADNLSPAYLDISEGKYLCLDQYLKDSSLYDFYPKMLWDSVLYNNSIYCIPNTNLPDCGLALVIKKSKYNEENIARFDNSLEGFDELLSETGVLGYGITDCSYLDMCNIPNNSLGIYYENGKPRNIMENDLNISWLKWLNGLVKEGRLCKVSTIAEIDSNEEVKWDIAMMYTGEAMQYDDNKYWKIFYKGDTGDNFAGSIAIRENTLKPLESFKMLELFITNKEYGNYIIYGDNIVNKDGYAINPDSGNKIYSFISKLYWGINDGVLRGEGDFYSFDSPESRKKYYDSYIRLGNIDWMRNRVFATKLLELYNKHERLIYNKISFEKELNNWIEESQDVFNLVD